MNFDQALKEACTSSGIYVSRYNELKASVPNSPLVASIEAHARTIFDHVLEPDDGVAYPSDGVEWDVSVRGPKMSDATGKVIFKYQMPVLESFTMKLPAGAEIVRTDDQGGMFWLWAIVNTHAPLEDRQFMAFKTGAEMPTDVKLRFVGFCAVFVQMELGLYIFEVVP